ncbi:MAG: hypothetical protein KDA25_01600 [Phycisphaerales bacterium]|nr:hypothetical protein [Phycisphaerales bacterium]
MRYDDGHSVGRGARRAGALAALALLALTSCRTVNIERSDGRPMPPKPRAARATPAGAMAQNMVFMPGTTPADSNGNGYPDTIQAAVMLSLGDMFVFEDGAFDLEVYSSGRYGTDPPLAQWVIEGDALERAKRRTGLGDQYWFSVSLLDYTTDVRPLTAVDLVCRFRPADGRPPVVSDGVRTLQLGRPSPGR